MDLPVSDAALRLLRRLFVPVEGSCEPWTDAEIVRRVLVRGAMEYAKSGGADFCSEARS